MKREAYRGCGPLFKERGEKPVGDRTSRYAQEWFRAVDDPYIGRRGPPMIEDGPGRVVLATVQHHASNVFALRIGDEGIHATGNHPFYSWERDEFVAAETLAIGELVQTREGPRSLEARQRVEGELAVFNMEVETDHEYSVGWALACTTLTLLYQPRYSPSGFATEGLLESHFVKHGNEWGVGNITRQGGASMIDVELV